LDAREHSWGYAGPDFNVLIGPPVIIAVVVATSAKAGLFDQCSLFLSFCLSVQDYCKNNQLISLKLGIMIGSTSRKI